MIKMMIIGSLGKDCVVKEVNGKNVINFSVAHSEKWKDNQGNQKEKTTWAECAYWTDKTGIVPYLNKGVTVYVEGAPEADAYTGNDGAAKGTLRLRVQTIQLVGGQKQPEVSGVPASNSYNAPAAKDSHPAFSPDHNSDLPF